MNKIKYQTTENEENLVLGDNTKLSVVTLN